MSELYIKNRDKCFNLMKNYLSIPLAFSDKCKEDLFMCFELMYKTGKSDKFDEIKKELNEFKQDK